MRWEDTPDLFGVGNGFSTCGNLQCGICGVVYNEDIDEDDDYSGIFIDYTDFAGINICEDCYEVVESEILARMPSILSWYKRIIDRRQSSLNKSRELITQITQGYEITEVLVENKFSEKLVGVTLDNCQLVTKYGRPEQVSGQCSGFAVSEVDDEPCEICKSCKLHYSYNDK